MKRDKHFFDITNWIFWVILGIILFLLLPYFKNGFFNEKNIDDWINNFDETKIDSTNYPPIPKPDTSNQHFININWSWKDFQGSSHRISFKIPDREYKNSFNYRIRYNEPIEDAKIYSDFINISAVAIDSMVNAMIKDMQVKKISGYEMMNYVVTAIQYTAYTKISAKNECPTFDMGQNWVNDCNARRDGRGCCNNVIPYAVYTPAEFIVQKTGDCDTKAIIAYAILKKLGFNAGVIVGQVGSGIDAGYHAMLAVADVIPDIPSEYVMHRGKIFYPWEVTNYNLNSKLGNMRMWSRWYNWAVVCD